MDWMGGYRCFKCWSETGNVGMCNHCEAKLNRLHRLDQREPDPNLAFGWEHPTAILHIGFLCVEETVEDLIRLRRDKTPAIDPVPARSKVGKTLDRRIRPINRVAARVAFDNHKEPA